MQVKKSVSELVQVKKTVSGPGWVKMSVSKVEWVKKLASEQGNSKSQFPNRASQKVSFQTRECQKVSFWTRSIKKDWETFMFTKRQLRTTNHYYCTVYSSVTPHLTFSFWTNRFPPRISSKWLRVGNSLFDSAVFIYGLDIYLIYCVVGHFWHICNKV